MASARRLWQRTNPLALYFVLAFAITWLLISPLALSAQGWLPVSISPHCHVLGALGPILAALIVTRLVSGPAGLGALVSSLKDFRIGPLWLFLGIFSPLLLFGLAALVLRIAGSPWPDFTVLLSDEYAGGAWVIGTLGSALAYGIGEEAGWRGFALPRLQSRRSALSATFILSLFWAAWHAPMFLYRFDFGPAEGIGFFIGMFAGAIVLSFFYNSTGGSIFMVAAWHSVWNVVNIVGLAVSMDVVAMMSAMVMTGAVIILIVWGPARLSVADKQKISDFDHEIRT